jgi:hypothetical protein
MSDLVVMIKPKKTKNRNYRPIPLVTATQPSQPSQFSQLSQDTMGSLPEKKAVLPTIASVLYMRTH